MVNTLPFMYSSLLPSQPPVVGYGFGAAVFPVANNYVLSNTQRQTVTETYSDRHRGRQKNRQRVVAFDSFLYASIVRLNSKKYFLNVFLFDANLSSA